MNTEQESTSRPIALGIAIVGGLIAALLRIVPHPPNFSGVGGLGVFGGARLRSWHAYLLPLGIMILSDMCLWAVTGFDYKYSLADLSRLPVYAGFMIYVLLGRWLCRKDSLVSVVVAATLGGLQFFVLTNFCEWLLQPWQPYYDQIPEIFQYSRDGAGLVKCFAMALGFYQQETPIAAHPFMVVTNFPASLLVWTILGDVLFASTYALAYRKMTERQTGAIPVATTNA
jgi:hypothetical protein